VRRRPGLLVIVLVVFLGTAVAVAGTAVVLLPAINGALAPLK
jgi:hypothetical protein